MKFDINETTLKQFSEKTVLDENGKSVVMSSLWDDQKTIIVFLRHFG